jgi:hypothetical protein
MHGWTGQNGCKNKEQYSFHIIFLSECMAESSQKNVLPREFDCKDNANQAQNKMKSFIFLP